MRVLIGSFVIALLAAIVPRVEAQHFIDLRSVNVTGEGWPPDHEAHSLIVDSIVVTFDHAAPIGAIFKGVANIPVNAFIKGDLRSELKGLLDKLRTGGSEGRHVVMKIDTLNVTERSLSSKELAYCRFTAQILERTDSGWARLYTFGTTLVRRGGLDATNDHAVNIAHALDNCLRRTASVIAVSGGSGQPVSEREWNKPFRRQVQGIRSIVDGRPKPGIYYSYMDFADGTPDTTKSFDLKETGNATELTRVVRPKGAEWDLQAWAISDGVHLYVNTGREFNEVTLSQSGLHTYWTPVGGDGMDAAGYAAIGFMFGAIGVGVAAAAGGGSGAPVRLDIDLDTGSLSRAHGPKSTTRDSEHWFCYSHHSKLDTSACLFLYGGAEGCLRKGQFHVVRLVPRVETVPVELRAGEQRAQMHLDTNASTDQVYLFSMKEDGTLNVDKVNAAMASAILDSLKPENEVK